jgi:hypothetical protein
VQLPDLIRMYLGVMGDKTGTLEACEPLEESDSSVKQIEDQGQIPRSVRRSEKKWWPSDRH